MFFAAGILTGLTIFMCVALRSLYVEHNGPLKYMFYKTRNQIETKSYCDHDYIHWGLCPNIEDNTNKIKFLISQGWEANPSSGNTTIWVKNRDIIIYTCKTSSAE